MTYISDVFFTTEMYVLIDDGSAMRPPSGSVTFRNVPQRPEAERVAPPHGGGCDTAPKPARKFSLLNAPPQSVTDSQATVNGSKRMPSCGSP